MAYYDEIPNELEKEKEYTERQILSFITKNRNVVIVGDETSYFNGSNTKKFRVIEAYEKFLHKQSENSSGVYAIPSTKTNFYRIIEVQS